MLNVDTLKNLNIPGENILKNDSITANSISNYNIESDRINNFLINSNLNNINLIK